MFKFKFVDKWRNTYKNLTPREYSKLSIKLMNTLIGPLGVNIANDCRVYWYSYGVGIGLLFHNICSIYRFFHFWKTNKLSAFQPIVGFATTIPVS